MRCYLLAVFYSLTDYQVWRFLQCIMCWLFYLA